MEQHFSPLSNTPSPSLPTPPPFSPLPPSLTPPLYLSLSPPSPWSKCSITRTPNQPGSSSTKRSGSPNHLHLHHCCCTPTIPFILHTLHFTPPNPPYDTLSSSPPLTLPPSPPSFTPPSPLTPPVILGVRLHPLPQRPPRGQGEHPHQRWHRVHRRIRGYSLQKGGSDYNNDYHLPPYPIN